MKKILFFFLIVLLNYILITSIVFLFSYFSLVNEKTYNFFWVKSIQEKLYTRGLRNIWHYQNDCVKFDKDLLYAPKDGECFFNNFEFESTLNFKNGIRLNYNNMPETKKNDSIALLGDSITMGWGVNDNETYGAHLEKLMGKKIYNLGTSSYGSVREIKKLKFSQIYKKVDTILIQYHVNDIYENKSLNIEKDYTEQEFNQNFKSDKTNLNKTIFFLRTFKTSLRLFFADILDKINPTANYYYVDFDDHKKYLEKIIYENLDYDNKNLIVLFIKEPNMKISNFPISTDIIKYMLVELNENDFFIIDEHPNVNGHINLANKIYKRLRNLSQN